jgi:hypothetical protein
MKTVLQELIENLESNIKGCEIALIDTIDKEFVKGTKRALEDVKIDISKYLEKEKEQIRTSYGQGRADSFSMPSRYASGTDYYNQTYNPETI